MMTRIACAVLGALIAFSGSDASAQSAQAMAQNCYVCHGPQARGADRIVPLAGMPRDHIQRQLADFKADRRGGTIMNRIAKGYSDEQIAAISDFLAKLPAAK
jgi:sulfide dehydrogenase cytochrome subunit